MTRACKAVLFTALAVVVTGTAAAPAMADSPRRESGLVSPLDHHAPIVGGLGTSHDIGAKDRHRP
ncbi:hypothetical protein AB0C96_30870 [Streptomyces sp. NPDC048506]|uniref:hypothetical protein n=1 Tax=Streptomyces sp. NPDC048506 TaxID=3155028 RepID=UPI003428FF58